MITLAGLDDLLNTYLGSRAKESAFYVGYVSATGFDGISSSDTMASHSWTEYTDYAEAVRPTLTFGASSGGVETNPTKVEMTPNADADVVGFFLATVSTKGGTTGRLPFIALFDGGTRSVKAGLLEQFTITVTATAG